MLVRRVAQSSVRESSSDWLYADRGGGFTDAVGGDVGDVLSGRGGNPRS